MYLERGDEVKVAGVWYPVIGYALTRNPKDSTNGSVFTLTPNGKPFEPCLGYRIDYTDIEDHRRPH